MSFASWSSLHERVGYAGPADAMHETRLGEAPVPSQEEINAHSELDGNEVDAEVFETLWSAYANAAK